MNISLERDMPIASGAAQEAIRHTLLELAEEARTGAVTLGAAAHAGTAETMRVEVPVIIETSAATRHSSGAFPFALRARLATEAFPKFAGAITVVGSTRPPSHVTLAGTYQVPLGPLGAVMNVMTFDGVARASLRRFFDQLVERAMVYIAENAEATYAANRRGAR